MEKSDLLRNERQERKAAKQSEMAEFEGLTNNDLFERRVALNAEAQRLQRDIADIKRRLGLIASELNRRNSPGKDIDVSEHAVVRYFERKLGLDVTAIRRAIRDAIPTDAKRGDKFSVDGITYVIAGNGRVTTLYEENPDDGPYRD